MEEGATDDSARTARGRPRTRARVGSAQAVPDQAHDHLHARWSAVRLRHRGHLGRTVFLMFAVINAVSFLFVRRYMPETRGRTLEELEDDFRSHDAAHYVHEAPVGVHGS